MKKFIGILTVLILMFSFITVNGDKLEGIKAEAQIGFDKSYKPGFVTPVFITLENDLKDIDGEIQIELPSDERTGGVNTITLYAMGINHPKGTTKKYTMNVPLPSSLLNVKFKVVEGKKTLYERYIRIDKRIPEETVVIGILSDDGDSLNYLNGFTLKSISNNFATKNIKLGEDTFPASLDVMENFSMLIINDFDTSKLSEDQYETLKKWVEQGGYLLIGTGSRGSKTLSIFKDDFITGKRGEVLRLSGDTLGAFVDDEFNKPIDIMNINLEDGEIIASQGDIPFIQKLDKGNGIIVINSFDMALEPISSWKLNKYFAELIFEKTAPNIFTGSRFEKFLFGRGYNWNIENALKNIPELPLPNYSGIIFLFIIYIILAAPVSYLILKKIDKRELMWGAVPILSFIFAIIIYLSGLSTRITEPLVNTVSLIYCDERGVAEAKAFGGIFTPKRTNLKVEGLGDVGLKPFASYNYYVNSDMQDYEGRRVSTKYILSPKPSIEFYDMGVWSMKTFSMDIKAPLEGNIKGDIQFIDSSFKGSIENNLGLNLKDCIVVTTNEYFELGDLEAGQRIEVGSQGRNSYSNGYELMDQIYGNVYPSGGIQDKDEIEKIRFNNQRRNILSYYFDSQVQRVQGIKLIGWSEVPVAENILVNGQNLKRYDSTLIIANLKLSQGEDNSIELPFGYVEPRMDAERLTDGSYDNYSNRFYGHGEVEVSYNIDKFVGVEEVRIRMQSPSSTTKQFIWNKGTKDWQQGDFASYTISGEDIKKYIGDENVLRFKFIISGDGIELPQISVKGSVK